MKNLEWSELLSVDIDEIDEDHRKLLEIFNLLNHALAGKESADYQAAVLEELINFTAWHFSHEERLMIKHGYRDFDEHKAAHRELLNSARQFQQRIIRADISMSDDDFVFLERWLTEHILTDDKRLGAYLLQVI